MVKLKKNFLGLPLVPSLRLHTLVYLWINLKLNFLSHKYTRLWYDNKDAFFIWNQGQEKTLTRLKEV